VTLRPARLSDVRACRKVRKANAAWLKPWDATRPEAAGKSRIRRSVGMARESPFWPYVSLARMRWAGMRRTRLVWAVRYDGQFAGQLSVWRFAWGANRSAELGYWIDERLAGRGITPTALAMAADHCFLVLGVHRLVASIRPENAASRRAVEKLGFRDEGIRVREVHIDGAWRDHICYAITAEEVPAGMLTRWRARVHASTQG
jgi:ribosomal-protein-alanine N-acetyltransferase